MKTTLYTFILVSLLGLSLAACQSSNQSITISEGDAGKTITLNKGDILVVELEGNITTGFSWIPAEQDPVLLERLGEPEVTPESNLMGAPGKIILNFQAVAKGQTTLHLDYMRSFETGVTPEQTFEVIVVVK